MEELKFAKLAAAHDSHLVMWYVLLLHFAAFAQHIRNKICLHISDVFDVHKL